MKIIEGMRGHTSGLAVPTYVIDLPGGGGKVPLQPDYVVSQTDEELILRNYEGHLFTFRNPVVRPLSPAKANRRNGGRTDTIQLALCYPDTGEAITQK